MKSLKERTEIQQAYLDGADVQCCHTGNDSYVSLDHYSEPDFNWMINDFRVKPKPMEIWVNIYSNGQFCLHDTKEEAERLASIGTSARRDAVKFIEVIE